MLKEAHLYTVWPGTVLCGASFMELPHPYTMGCMLCAQSGKRGNSFSQLLILGRADSGACLHGYTARSSFHLFSLCFCLHSLGTVRQAVSGSRAGRIYRSDFKKENNTTTKKPKVIATTSLVFFTLCLSFPRKSWLLLLSYFMTSAWTWSNIHNDTSPSWTPVLLLHKFNYI